MPVDVLALIAKCRSAAASFLAAREHASPEGRFWLHSEAHDPLAYPDLLLYSTWAGALASVLLGRLGPSSPLGLRQEIGRAINSFQQSDGTFRMTRLRASLMDGHDEEYVAFHFTNYAMGALVALGLRATRPLLFLESLAEPGALEEWLARRNWDRPWTEGNNLVNLASFYALRAEDGVDWAAERLAELVHWQDRNQKADTGLWHSAGVGGRSGMLQAIAGAAHLLHVYFYLGRPVPRPETIIDTCLQRGYFGIRSACIDIDIVDILANLRRYGYRVREIDVVLRNYLVELLQLQNSDGGFADTYVTPHAMYGVVTPVGESVMWTTWFRLATIGMISTVLFPGQGSDWVFRTTLGMGYFNLSAAAESDAENGASRGDLVLRVTVPGPTAELLALRRKARFLRHRSTWLARRWLRANLWRG